MGSEESEFITDTYHIVGDKAFPLSEHILTPYKKSKRRSRTRAEKIYNKHLASKRQVSFYLILTASKIVVRMKNVFCKISNKTHIQIIFFFRMLKEHSDYY